MFTPNDFVGTTSDVYVYRGLSLYDIVLEIRGFQQTATDTTWRGIIYCKTTIGGIETSVQMLADESGVYDLTIPYHYGPAVPTESDRVSAEVCLFIYLLY